MLLTGAFRILVVECLFRAVWRVLSRRSSCLPRPLRSLNLERVCGHFFFSSRRRHTRYIGDWSSDVCSSDLELVGHVRRPPGHLDALLNALFIDGIHVLDPPTHPAAFVVRLVLETREGARVLRSEERRVGKDYWVRGWLDG